MDLVNDVLRKRRKSDPVGWQTFAQQLKRINLPMEMVGNVDRRRYIQTGVRTPEQFKTSRGPLVSHWTPMFVGKWNSPKVLGNLGPVVVVGRRHSTVGSPIKRISRYDDSTVYHDRASGCVVHGGARWRTVAHGGARWRTVAHGGLRCVLPLTSLLISCL